MFKAFLIPILMVNCLYGQKFSPKQISILESQICTQPRRCIPNNQCREISGVNDYGEEKLFNFELTYRNTIVLRNGEEAQVCDHTERCCGGQSSQLSNNNYLNSLVTNTRKTNRYSSHGVNNHVGNRPYRGTNSNLPTNLDASQFRTNNRDIISNAPSHRGGINNFVFNTNLPNVIQRNGCGYRRRQNAPVINTDTDEQESESGEFPWTVALLSRNRNGMKFTLFCGGSLIHPSVVLTAAHCANRQWMQDIQIRVGEVNSAFNSDAQFQFRNVKEIVRHDLFNEPLLFNDIALIVAEQPFVLNDYVKTICLPTQKMGSDDEQHCYTSGWDRNTATNPISKLPAVFMKSETHVLPAAMCQNQLRRTRLSPYFRLHSSFKCASGANGQDTCTGDGGSPLICPMQSKPNRYYQSGIVSWGIGCGNEHVPGVYADVAGHRTWINRKMEERNYGTESYTY